eukprot:4560116-Pleurochrysis_carterae.AAC.1
MRGAAASVGSAPSARSCASALSTFASASSSSPFERCLPPVDQEIACSARPRPSTRISICSRR